MTMTKRASAALTLLALAAALAAPATAEDADEAWLVPRVAADLAHPDPDAPFWAAVPERVVTLVAQPMIRPRPAETTTGELAVRVAHDGERLALRLVWSDPEASDAGPLGEYSDGAAVQFPMRPGESPPPIFMGLRGMPVHIFHWRAQYQRDQERGKPTMRDLYPNMSIDMYPMEYPDPGAVEIGATAGEEYSPGVAVGNPQSFPKSAVDEIWAEGFSTSSVRESVAAGYGTHRDGRWEVVIVRPLRREGGSSFAPGETTFVAFAVWQGGEGEVGARKSVTMSWTSLRFADAAALATEPRAALAEAR
jgi:hypothetical protein